MKLKIFSISKLTQEEYNYWFALMDYEKQKKVNKIIITRPIVEAGENLGFLPGELKEKVDPYLTPIYDALHDILGKETTDKYLDKGVIEIAPLAYMRGRTLSDAFVKSMEEGFVALKDTATIEKVDALKDLEKNIDDLKTVDELKEFFNKQKDDLVKLTDDELKLIGDDLAKMELEKGKNSLKRLMKTEGKYSQYFKFFF